jgi:hypothetical protein
MNYSSGISTTIYRSEDLKENKEIHTISIRFFLESTKMLPKFPLTFYLHLTIATFNQEEKSSHFYHTFGKIRRNIPWRGHHEIFVFIGIFTGVYYFFSGY